MAAAVWGLFASAAGEVLAAGAWVVVDDSKSMSHLARNCVANMRDLLVTGAPDQLFISTIAPLSNQAWRVDSQDSEAAAQVEKVFSFDGLTTPIAESLRRAQSDPAFAAVDQVVIVTDMDPDHRASSEPFHFDRADIGDLDETLKLLEQWLAAGKTIDLVLQDWDQAALICGASHDQLAAFPADLDRAISDLESEQRNWRPAPGQRFQEPPRRGGTKGDVTKARRKLVACGLAWLAERHPGQLRLSAIPTRDSDDQPNEEAFRDQLCAILKPHLANHADACLGVGGGTGDAVAITTRIDISNRLMREDLIERVVRQWPPNVNAAGNPRPLARPIVNSGIGGADDPDAVLHFRVRPGLQGTEPFHYPELHVRGRAKDGQVHENVIAADHALGDKEQMIDWVVATAKAYTDDFVRQYWPLEMRLKRIWITTATGRPIPDGLYFQVVYNNGTPDDGYTNVAASRWGAVLLRLPAAFKLANLLLVTPDGTVVDEVGRLDLKQVLAPRDVDARLKSEFESDIRVLYCEPLPNDAAKCLDELKGPVDVRLFLITGQNEQREWPVAEGASEGGVRLERKGATITLHGLLPGKYLLDSRVRERRPIWLAANDLSLDPQKKRDERDIILPMVRDRLADGWDPTLFEFQQSGNSYNLSSDSRAHLRGSAWYIQRLLEQTSKIMDKPGGPDPNERQHFKDLWQAIRGEIWGQAGRAGETERYQRWLAPALEPFGIVANGQVTEGGMQLVEAMFNRFIDGFDARLDRSDASMVGFQERYRTMAHDLKQIGLIQDALYQPLITGRKAGAAP